MGRPQVIDLNNIKDRRSGTISCCMIARDEEGFIADALYSVKELVDEMIVIDTGSTDTTAVEARACGAKVYGIDWNGDFSEARNFALSKATKEWILVLDADEIVRREDHVPIRDVIGRFPAAAVMFDQWTYSDCSGEFGWREVPEGSGLSRGQPGYIPARQIRLFRNDGHARYCGFVGESVEPSLLDAGVSVLEAGVVVHHYGRVDESNRVHRKCLAYLARENGEIGRGRGSTYFIYEMAVQLVHLGRFEEAAGLAGVGLEAEPRSWELMNVRGLANLKMGALDPAEACFRGAIERAGDRAELYNNLGVTLVEKGDEAPALRLFETAVGLDGRNAALLVNAAYACMSAGLHDRAARYVSRSIALDPFNPSPHVIRAEILLGHGDFDGACRALEKVRFLPSVHLRDHLRAISIYIKMAKTEEAEAFVGRAIEEYPERRELLYLYGKILEKRGLEDKAVSIYNRILALSPAEPDVLNSLGCIYEKRGMLEDAALTFRKALDSRPGDPRIEVNLGVVLGKIGADHEAEMHLKNAIGRRFECGFACNALGCHLARAGRYLESLRYLESAVKIEPANAGYHMNLGLALERAGMFARAAEVYDRLASVDAAAVNSALESLMQPVESISWLTK